MQYQTLEKYLQDAKNVIKWVRPGMKLTEDNISYVAEAMMRADERFNGYGERTSFRISIGKFAVMSLATKFGKTKQRDIKTVSLFNNDGKDLYHTLPAPEVKTGPDSSVIAEDIINLYCPDKYKECLQLKYLQGKTLQEIADMKKVTKQCISLQIIEAIKIIKENFKNGKVESIDNLMLS